MAIEATICWICKNACGSCSWSKSFTPVENWVAKPTKLKIGDGRYVDSYIVKKCPRYVEG